MRNQVLLALWLSLPVLAVPATFQSQGPPNPLAASKVQEVFEGWYLWSDTESRAVPHNYDPFLLWADSTELIGKSQRLFYKGGGSRGP